MLSAVSDVVSVLIGHWVGDHFPHLQGKKLKLNLTRAIHTVKGKYFYCSTVTPLDIQQTRITFKDNLMQFAGQSTAGSAVSPSGKVFLSWFIQEKAAQHPIYCSNMRGKGNEKMYRGPAQKSECVSPENAFVMKFESF